MSNLFNIGKKLLMNNFILTRICSVIYNLFSFNLIVKKGNNNTIDKKMCFLKKCKINIVGNNNEIIFGNMNFLQNTKINIYGNNNKIILGNKVFVSEGDFYIEDNENKLTIGERTTFAGYTHLALTEGKNINIGSKCLFSKNVIFRTGDSHSIIDINTLKRINYGKDIDVGNHVWFTYGTTVLKGAKISNDSIIATSAVVTKSFNNPNVILAGNPAKEIKKNITWDNERIGVEINEKIKSNDNNRDKT